MSDDLVKRLRDDSGDWLTDLAADRIEELEAQVNWYRDRVVWGFYEEETPKFYQGKAGEHEICEPLDAEQVTNYFKALDIYERRLAKVVKALKYYAQDDDDGGWLATETLAELKGGKDE